MKVKIIDQDMYGDGVAKIDNIPIFVEQALPTEEVEITITRDKKKYKRAKIDRLVKPSTQRVTPSCPYYNDCGGCNLLHQEYKATLKYKKNKVLNNLSKIAGLNDIKIGKIISGNQFNYRNKVTLHVKDNKLGFYKKNSNNLINIDKCLLLNNNLNNIIEEMNKLNLKNITEVVIRTSEYNNKTLILLTYNNDINDLINNLVKIKEIDTIVITKDNKYKVVYNEGYITEKIGDYVFNISAPSFFQVNTEIATQLYKEISLYLNDNKKSTVLDLYCGTGSIGLSIANQVKKVIGIEKETVAIENANSNKELNNINKIEFILGTVENKINDIKKVDIVIIDPPRAGCDPKTLDYIVKIKPQAIIYVSCDSSTLARDIKHINNDYEITDIKIFDMFPNTYHIEVLAYLQKK